MKSITTEKTLVNRSGMEEGTLAAVWMDYKAGNGSNLGKILLEYLDNHPEEAKAVADKSKSFVPIGITLFRAGDKTGLSWSSDKQIIKDYFPDEPVYKLRVTPEVHNRIIGHEDAFPFNSYSATLGETEILIRPESKGRPITKKTYPKATVKFAGLHDADIE